MIRKLIVFCDLDSTDGNLALYKLLTLAGVWLSASMALQGAAWPAVTVFIAVLAASFGRNTFLRFLDRHSTVVTGKFDTTITGSVKDLIAGRDLIAGMEPTE